MTKEEAINSFKKSNEQTKLNIQAHRHIMDTSEIRELEWYIERDKMAIEALEQEPCEDMERKIEKEYLFESLCEDLKKLQAENENLRNALKQETKTGRWLELEHNPNYECSKCHRWYTKRTNFCPNCGIKIESEK